MTVSSKASKYSSAPYLSQRKANSWCHAEDDAMSEILTAEAILYGLLVFSGILGNILVIHVVFQSAFESPSQRLSPSDTILVHLSLANLLTSLFRTVPIFVSDLGLDVSLSPGWCRVFMLLWVWWRAVGCWVTLTLSIFHCTTLRRHHVTFGPLTLQRERRRVWVVLVLVWGANLAFSMPALLYTTHVKGNATVKLMVISCTTRPLLGCIWEFPTNQQGSAFASTSLALNELLPLVLMVCTNLATLYSLAKHIRAVTSGSESGSHGEMDKHVSTERKAAHVIISLVSLFVVCWVLQVAAVTYYNHDGGYHAEGLLNVAQFSASLFVGFSPLVVALGHGKLRRKLKSMILVWTNVSNSQETGRGKKSPPKKGKQTNFVAQKEMRVIKVKGKVKSQR
ncbi:Olfactory receptor class A-like protein 4 [Characodon lateralis]|uniref:Olfactory receptor class A-like protein 4 n=1 Tax=Characodon lateralis TaxID=208331 RepID=A0ABU7F655_9TELE|nr:Olfactory receptor class A-like protein 4 [Characodon lateralis]